MSHPSVAVAARFGELRRAEFAGLGDSAYLDAASFTPLPERARAAAEEFNQRRAHVQTLRGEHFSTVVQGAREACARLINADPAEIALGGNTSFGINLAALGLPMPEGSTVLVSEREFPANVYPWMNRDRFQLELVPCDANGWPDEDRIFQRIRDPKVSVLALSSVQFANGYQADLHRFGHACRETNTFFVVDAIQSLGQLPLDVTHTPIDVLSAGGQKWLCGPFGVGFAYVRREIQEQLDPAVVGWFSMASCQNLESLVEYEWRLLPDARKYEQATPPFQDLATFGASVGLLLEVGVPAIAEYLDLLLEPLRSWLLDQPDVESLSSHEPRKRSAIISFRPRELEPALLALREAGVVCSIREGGIRVAPHLYNLPSDIDRVIDVLESRVRR